MDIQRAIKRVQRGLRWAAESSDKEAIEDLSIALKALEKQIPKKVIGYECPNCGECTDFNGVNKFDYCAECGQRLELNKDI